MHLAENRDGSTKGQMVCNGELTREWQNKEELASPTVATDGSFHTMILDAEEAMCLVSP